MYVRHGVALTLFGLLVIAPGYAGEVTVAVATNFVAPMEILVEDYQQRRAHTVRLVKGSTGGLHAQILNGAPYDVLIAADQRRPSLLASSGHGLAETQFTVALGRLALWSPILLSIEERGLQALQDERVRHLAIASPDLAPYGEAARQVLKALGLWVALSPRIVRGQNVAQAYAMVATRSAEMGLIALSQVRPGSSASEYFIVPEHLHDAIRQDAILLARGGRNQAALALLAYLKSDAAHNVIVTFGYGLPD